MQDRPYMLVFLVALSASYMLTLVIRRISVKLHLLDFPAERKVHIVAVPYLGGVAVFAGFMMALTVALHLDRPFRFEFLQEFVGLFVATSLIFLLGIFDDLGGSTAGLKFTIQGVAATVLWGYGFRIETLRSPFGSEWLLTRELGWLLTLLWFWSVTNAMNLIDGLDGLCAGIGAIAATALVVTGIARGESVLPFLAIALSGALLGFLPHNMHPAKIFLGDTGSLTIGFLIAAMGLASLTKATTVITLLVPVAMLALPVADTALAIVRRSRLKKNLFQADRMHIHHRLLRLMPHGNAVILLWTLTGYSSVLGVAMIFTKFTTAIWIFIILVATIMGTMILLRFWERAAGIDFLEDE